MEYRSIFKETAKLISPVYFDVDKLKSIVNFFLAEEKDEKNKKSLQSLLSYLDHTEDASKQNTIEYKLFDHVMQTQTVDGLESYARDYIIDERTSESKVSPLVRMVKSVFEYLVSQPFDKKSGFPIGMKESSRISKSK